MAMSLIGDCASKCSGLGDASLACLQSSTDSQFVYDWLFEDGNPDFVGRGLWLGTYKDETWTRCAGGQATSFNNFTQEADRINDLAPDSAQCAVMEGNGWHDRVCVAWYRCLCESGTGTSSTYTAWYNANVSRWMAPWVARAVWTMVIGVIVGLLPALIGLLLWLLRGRPTPEDFQQRVRVRVIFVTRSLGSFLLCLASAPILAFFLGFHTVYVLGYPQGYAAMLPVAFCLLLMAVIPDNQVAVRWALITVLVFFVGLTLVGVIAIIFWVTTWILGLLAGLVYTLSGIAFTVAITMGFRLESPYRLRRAWQCVRLFMLMQFVVSVIMLVEYIVTLSSQFSENIGWVFLIITSLVCAAVARPHWRAAFCIWLAKRGLSDTDRAKAEEAASLIWLEISPSEKETEKPGPEPTVVGAVVTKDP